MEGKVYLSDYDRLVLIQVKEGIQKILSKFEDSELVRIEAESESAQLNRELREWPS